MILFSAFYFLFSSWAMAASLNLISPISEVGVGDQFKVDIIINTLDASINALEGKVIFPSDLVEAKEIRDGNSIVNFWVIRPGIGDSQVAYAGVIPGGYAGRSGHVFSIIFQAKNAGKANIEFRDAAALLNDGSGTKVLLTLGNIGLTVFAPKTGPVIVPKISDIELPEPFNLQIAKDPNIFEGKWFLVFATQDKNSGIDHYEAQENGNKSALDKWITAESPYQLKDQKLYSYIYVRAIDKAGNEKLAFLTPTFMPWYKKPIVDIIIGFIGLVVLLLIRWLLRLRSKKH